MTEQQKGIINALLIIAVLVVANIVGPILGDYLTPDEQSFLFLVSVYLGARFTPS